jgi:ABC-type uncharacterized transport system involved in gliding motility auxiliary subunit
MNAAWLQARQTKYGAYLTVYILVVLAIIAGANWLANQNNKSYDTTSNKRFSLSDATKKTLESLKNDVSITYFDRTSAFENARTTLDRYKDLSGKIKLNFIDPEKKPEIARLAHVQNFGAIFVDYGTKHEEAKSLTEEEITGAIKRAMSSGVRTACFVAGSGEASISDTDRDGYSRIKDLLDKSGVKTKEVDLLQKAKAEIDKDCTILVIGGPTHDYIPPVRDSIKKFVDDGGKAMVMFTPSIEKNSTGEGEPNLEKLVAEWGVNVNNDLIYDLGPYSEIFGKTVVVVGHYDTHAVVKDMGRSATVFPLSRSLEVASGKSMEKLFESGDASFQIASLKPPFTGNPDKDKKGPFTIGAAGTVNGKARVVVIGSSNWISNSALSLPAANRDLALNMVNWLTADESLISIPSKEPEDRRILLSGTQMNMIALSSVILLPLLVVVSGFAVWWKRR